LRLVLGLGVVSVQWGFATVDERQRDSASFSAIARTARWVFARRIVGIIEASATVRASVPRTAPLPSTTVPIAQVPTGS
jgi:hypothetical protein